MPRPSRELLAVQEALPAYEVLDEIGRGAFGVVYAGRHRQLGRSVAIKQLPRAFAADPAVRERFVDEARLVASLDHPHRAGLRLRRPGRRAVPAHHGALREPVERPFS
ncbi:MAG: protein kinase [Ilumatobacteraceae bacterium]